MSDGHMQESDREPLIWDLVEWRQGDGRYRFEVAQGGLHATLTSPNGQSLTLPMVAWDGLLDALTASRKTKARVPQNLPPRAGARWSAKEIEQLTAAYNAGATVDGLALAHNRTGMAIEAQLAAQGLWDRTMRGPPQGSGRGSRSMLPPDWPPDPPPPPMPERWAAQPRPSSG